MSHASDGAVPITGALSASTHLDEFVLTVLDGVVQGWKPDRWRQELHDRFGIYQDEQGRWMRAYTTESYNGRR